MRKIPILFDMETADPDDVMTLAILACHPRAALVGVTVTPGGPDQVGVVREVLKRLGVTGIPIGAGSPKPDKRYVSAFHMKWLGSFPDAEADASAPVVMASVLAAHPETTLLTGARLTNVSDFLEASPYPSPCFKGWVGQGGFCGDSLVAPEHRLAKFAGRETCPTFNFNGDVGATMRVLAERRIHHKLLVGKNVCHGVAWDRAFHARALDLPRRTAGLNLVLEGMTVYLQKNPDGKKLHDPLAACAILRGAVVQVREVEVYRERGEWGSKAVDPDRLQLETDTPAPIVAAVSYDPVAFFQTLTES